jgi:hypothetical protein
MDGRIFLNYRQADSAAWAGWLHHRLLDDFRPDQLFIDIDNIEPGVDFTRVLDERVATCDAFIMIIGRDWLTARDENGELRLDNIKDFVRIEIEAALKRDIRVIPMLVDGARMPRPDQLPESLRPLVLRHAIAVTHESFAREVAKVVASLRRMAPFSGSPVMQPSLANSAASHVVVAAGGNDVADNSGPADILLGTLVIAVATLVLAGLVVFPGALRDAWCNNIGTFCGSTVPEPVSLASGVVFVESGGTKDNNSDECKTHKAEVCMSPSRSDRKLLVGSAKFELTERSGGVFVDGNPTNSDPIGTSNVGWLIDGTRNSPSQICVIAFARTSACETKVFLRGKLRVNEISAK